MELQKLRDGTFSEWIIKYECTLYSTEHININILYYMGMGTLYIHTISLCFVSLGDCLDSFGLLFIYYHTTILHISLRNTLWFAFFEGFINKFKPLVDYLIPFISVNLLRLASPKPLLSILCCHFPISYLQIFIFIFLLIVLEELTPQNEWLMETYKTEHFLRWCKNPAFITEDQAREDTRCVALKNPRYINILLKILCFIM